VARLVLTASGGPFRGRASLSGVSPEEALAHPTWDMGPVVTVNSASMMNKGLELIEAHLLFDVPYDRIEVVVHPQSVVHSLVGFKDGSVLAQLGEPDMRIPIAHALGYPGRLVSQAPRLDLARHARLEFEPPDEVRFPALALARRALRSGGTAPTILNAANEVAVAAFLGRRIGFLAIADVVAETLERCAVGEPGTVEAVVAADAQARRVAIEIAGRLKAPG